jgi:hypothetical protein
MHRSVVIRLRVRAVDGCGEVALLTGADVTVTGKPAAAAGSPGSGRDGQQAAAEQVRGDLPAGESSARQCEGGPEWGRPTACGSGREEAGT